jgi:two-component system sensor histidine kinase UhpB
MRGRSRAGGGPVKARRRKAATRKRRHAAKDVFVRKRTQLESRTTEQRWRSFLENPIFGITFVDEHQRFITTNQTFQAMVGYSNDELRQLTPLDISVPEEREINEAFLREIQQGKRHHFEMMKQLRRKDGKLIWINLYVFAITDRKSGAKLSFGMAFDITEKKQAQDALKETRAELARVARMNQLVAMTGSIAHSPFPPL